MSINNSDDKEITKENLDTYLNEFAKLFKKLNGSKMTAEIVIVGGASVLLNYNFRRSTKDIDAVIKSSSVIKDVIGIIGEKYKLPSDWLNADFIKTKSYSPKLREVSIHYKTYYSVLEIRTIKSEYLIAMKLMAGRDYKHDLSDIVGIFWEQQKKGNPIEKDILEKAIITLYGSLDNLPEDSIEFINRIFLNNDNYEKLFSEIKNEEENAKKLLNIFTEEYPNAVNRDNINLIVKKLINIDKQGKINN
ncbi:MAG: DUF6036 family nucleotidyltransferase [Treponema sp.]|nr:DUF6036 family nucleotidyltransferase [Treponema sp.]